MTIEIKCNSCRETQFEDELIDGYRCSYCQSDSLSEREVLEEQAERAIARMNDHFLDRVMEGV